MKCIRDKADLETHRVTDHDAARKVKSGRFEFIDRTTWKIQGRRK